tara:strand:- start:22062 stop:22958 length:897 start_codon:yes stop_codon:yes gene_type:complete
VNPNESRTLWISVGAALFAVFLLYSYTQEKTEQLSEEFGTKQRVVVATQDIDEMQTIDETMLQIVERPTKFIHADSIDNPEIAVGRVALAPIRKDEIMLSSKIIQPSPVTGLSLQVAPGKRAVTLPVDDIRGVARLIKPGDRIDLLAAVDVGSGLNQKKEVRTIMQDVLILATGLKVANELPRLYERAGNNDYIKNIRADTTFTNVTVEVDPKEAQNLVYVLATNPSSLYFTLRHPSDRGARVSLRPTTNETIRGKISSAVVKRQVSSRPTITRPKKTTPKTTPKKKTKKSNGGFQTF